MLWDIFGDELELVLAEEVFQLSSAEIDAFTCLKYHHVETVLALITKQEAPPAMIN